MVLCFKFMNEPIKTVKMTNTEDGHSKVWIGELYADGTVIAAWGRLDQENLQSKEFFQAGEEFLNKKIKEKIKKGYKE